MLVEFLVIRLSMILTVDVVSAYVELGWLVGLLSPHSLSRPMTNYLKLRGQIPQDRTNTSEFSQ